MNSRFRPFLLCAWLALAAGFHRANAQWITQSFTLKPGWNAIHLHVDATGDTLENLVGVSSPISEIWLWQPNGGAGRIISNPLPLSGSDWLSWTKAKGPANAFALRANSTYLVRNSSPANFVWNLKGKPVPPAVQWTASGLNFIGFPTRAGSPPLFSSFLLPSQALNDFSLFQYPGGEAADAPPNAVSLFSLNSKTVARGEAFWITRDRTDNRYFGPFEIALQDNRGITFSDTRGTYSFRLRNQTAGTNRIALTLLASETSPAGESLPVPPLLLRTSLNTVTLQYGFMPVGAGQGTNFVLAPTGRPGSEVEVVFGLDRSNMAGTNGTPFAAILRLEDTTLGHLQVDLPVSANKDSTEGLWVGEASIKQVGNYLKTYAKATNAVDFTNQLAQLNLLNEGQKTVSFPASAWTARSLSFADRTPLALGNRWVAVASSTNGNRLVAAMTNGPIYTSADAGATWLGQPGSPVADWRAVASSADGLKLVAAVGGGRIYTSTDAGATWTARDSARDWVSVASSADGARLVAAVSGGQLYTSADSGATWTARATARAWVSVASSANGTNLVVAVAAGQLYTSTDAGTTWTPRDSARAWVSVASSAGGTSLVAAEAGGRLYISVDAGLTWAARDIARNWASVASSAGGTNLVAAVAGGQLYTSMDAGFTWTVRDSVRAWRSVAASADGSNLVAAVFDGQLYTSGDAGVTWGSVAPFVSSLASSADGLKLIAAAKGSRLYTSADAGTNWTAQTGSPTTNWQAVASSADGVKLLAAVEGGGVYASPNSGATWSLTSLPSAYWQSVASSDDGLKLVAVADGGDIHTSGDGGVNWVHRIPLANQKWQAVASSANGQKLLAAIRGGQLYASTNSGVNWVALIGAATTQWQSVASSADGKVLYAAENPGGIHASTDGGVTWDLKASAPPAARWKSIACSSNGSAVVAVVEGGQIYTSNDAGKSWTPRESSRTWAAVASSADGTRVVASEAGGSGQIYSQSGTLVTPAVTFDPNSGLILSGGRKYLEAGFDSELGDVPTPFPLRLLVHQDRDGTTRLLQRVYVGPDALTTNTILTLQESKLHPDKLSQARRLSAVHLPLSGSPWKLEGDFGGVGIMNTVLTEGFANSASNPFLHAYHPDHDNLDALYQPITKPGAESYDIRRQITLSFTPPGDDFSSRTAGGSRVQGTYLEHIVLKGGNNQTRTVVTKGSFILNRVSSIATIR